MLHPRARRKAHLSRLLERLHTRWSLTLEESRFPGHLREFCRERLPHFRGPVLTAGGDGTLHEAVNGWADAGFPEGPRFAPLPLGTGNDFLFSIDRRWRGPESFLDQLPEWSGDADLGRVTFQTPEGPSSRVFCVGATTGFSALVTRRRALLAPYIPGSLSYLLALFVSLGSWRSTWCHLDGELGPQRTPVFFNLNCANVKHYGGGMWSAPRAEPFARQLEGVAMNLTLSQVLRALPQNFRGDFDSVPRVEQFPIRGRLAVETGRPCPVQADGELLGETPMTVELLSQRLPVLLPWSPQSRQ